MAKKTNNTENSDEIPDKAGQTWYQNMHIPDDEKWLFENPKALASVMRGLEEARQGKVITIDPARLKDTDT